MKTTLLVIACIASNLFCSAQATMVSDINQGNASSDPTEKIVFNNEVYFSADDGINGQELWKTDGTEAGTVLLKDINLGQETGIKTFHPLATANFFYFDCSNFCSICFP